MNEEIWYREELQCLLDMITAEICRLGPQRHRNEQAALGHLHGKLSRAIENAPGALAS